MDMDEIKTMLIEHGINHHKAEILEPYWKPGCVGIREYMILYHATPNKVIECSMSIDAITATENIIRHVAGKVIAKLAEDLKAQYGA